MQEILPCALATLRAARATKKLRPDLAVAGGLTTVQFGSGYHTFASILRGADYREEWQFLKSLEQTSPWGEGEMVPPDNGEEVRFQDRVGIGLLQAVRNQSAVLSFALNITWEVLFLAAKHSRLDDSANVVPVDVEIPNIAKLEHVTAHEDLIRNYGHDLSSSSVIFACQDFVIRMYFNDHPLPHFHVMSQEDSSQTLARFSIQTLDQMEQSGWLRPAIRKRIIEWASPQKAALMNCWDDCRRHRHPARLD